MKYIWLTVVFCLGVASCAVPPPPPVFNARLYTVDNQEITLRNFKVFEKNNQIESEEFHTRWRQSLELVTLDFNEVASAQKIDSDTTRVRLRDGSEDDFTEFFEDEYNLRGWSDYGPFEISATLVMGLIFVDEKGNPVPGALAEIPPLIPPPVELDRFITFNGDIISGSIIGDRFKILTTYGTLMLDREAIMEIIIDREGDELKQIVHFKNGDILSGWFEPIKFQMEVSDGQVITMEVEDLSRIFFSRPMVVEED